MKKTIIRNLKRWAAASVLAITLSSCATAPALYNEDMDPAILGRSAIATADRALTFARYLEEGELQLVLVSSYIDSRITGVNLSLIDDSIPADPKAFFSKYGYDGLVEFSATQKYQVTFSEESAVIPVDLASKNIAVGYNYRAHVEEVKEDEPPFLFPKHTPATPFNSPIPVTGYTLPDYELELGMVLLQDVTSKEQAFDFLGFMLANDFTDRDYIVQKHVDVLMKRYEALPDGIQGYPDAKNFPGAFPVGNLFIIPRNYKSYLEELDMALYLNGRLRQKADPSLLVWDPEKCVSETFKRSSWDYEFKVSGRQDRLLDNPEVIPAGTMILSGTPEGVIFKKAYMGNPSVFLKPGDQLVLYADGLGFIQNTIVK